MDFGPSKIQSGNQSRTGIYSIEQCEGFSSTSRDARHFLPHNDTTYSLKESSPCCGNSVLQILFAITMVTQRKRHLQEASRSLHHGILPLQDDDDDDNSKQHRKRRSVRRHTPTMIQSVLLTVLSLIILFWLNGWASDVLVRKQTGPVVVLLFPDVAKPSPGIARPRSRYTSRIPDWGGLELSRIRGKSFQRRIHRHDEEHYNEERHEFLHEIDEENEEWASAYDEHIEEYSSCQPTNWKNKIFPVCNTFHELQRNWGSDQLLG